MGNISELSFNLPYRIEISHKLKRNKHIDLIREKMLIKLTIGTVIEYFTINKVKDSMDSGSEVRTVECFGLGYELSSKLIRNYSVLSKTASFLLNDVLKETTWEIDFVDADFDIKYRALDVPSSSVLDTVINIAQTFNALIVWDTVNRKINCFNFDNIGQNRGLKIKYSKLMQSVTKEADSTEFCTRLKVFGRDDLSINSVNPTGTNFIQSFDYFMYPFTVVNNVVTQSSYYFSDSLCLAIRAYEALVANNTTTYQTLLSTRATLQSDLITLTAQLNDLKAQLDIIEDNLSIANKAQQNTSSLISQKVAKNAEIASKQTQIDNKNGQLTTNLTSMNNLKTLLSMETNFTQTQLTELNPFIIEKEWSNANILDAKELLDAAKLEFDKIREPSIKVEVSVVNFLEIMSEQHNWDKLHLGDIITIQHDRIGIEVEAKITEINYNYSNGEINLTIANVKDILSDYEKFMKDHIKNISSSTTVDMSKYGWDDAKDKADEVSLILSNKLSAVSHEIVASNNETVEISRKGIRLFDNVDQKKQVVMQHGVIALTNNDGNTWDTAIDATGIYAKKLIGQIIAGNNLTITNTNGSFLVNETGLTATNLSLTLTRSDNKSRILMDATNGFKIQNSSNGTTWSDKFSADTLGNLKITGEINATSGTFSGNITASGTITGGAFSGASFNNGTITGSLIQTNTSGSYPRIQLSNTNNILRAETSSLNNLEMRALLSDSGTPALTFNTPYGMSWLTKYDDRVWLEGQSSTIQISCYRDIVINPGSGYYLKVPSWSQIYSTSSFKSLQQELSYFYDLFGSLNTRMDANDNSIVHILQSLASLWTALDGKANAGHSHSGTITTANHNHGNIANLTNGGQTISFTVS